MTHEWTHDEHTITVTEEGLFRVIGPLFEDATQYERQHESLDKARETISRFRKIENTKAREKLSLAVVSPNGKRLTITGIHARNQNLLGIGDERCVYAYAIGVTALCLEAEGLRKRLRSIEKALSPYTISFQRHGRKPYEQLIADLKQEHATKLATPLPRVEA